MCHYVSAGVCHMSMCVQVCVKYHNVCAGVCHVSYPLNKMPGWDKNSLGYHGDDGRLVPTLGHPQTYAYIYICIYIHINF